MNIYTPNIDNFRTNNIKNHINNEDIIFCNRSELEYHINLIAAEIMSKIYKKEFENREKIIILLPSCMKIQSSNCLAIEDDIGLKYIGCNNKCNIGKVSKQFNNNHNSVYIVNHASSILSNLSSDAKNKIGIVGVACINNLIEGGWKIASCGIPPQCVILDYVGCKKHWTPEDVETTFSIDKLESTVF